MKSRIGVLTASVLLLAACGGRSSDRAGDRTPIDGGGGRDGASHDGASGDGAITFDASNPTDCSDAARWIYLVDESNAFLRFQPDTMTLTPIGTLACPSSSTPFSMAVDRNAVAWVLFQDGNIFHVDATTVACSATSFVPNQMGFEVFGMGFVSDAAGSSSETLYIAGGPLSGIGSGTSTLGSIDTTTLVVSRVGTVSGSPELTGNGAAELWGFFPDSSPMTVEHLDKSTASILQTFDVSAVDPAMSTPTAWAFAFWGGRYYIFYETSADTSTNIWRITPDTGVVEPVMMNIGYKIVGAGVSTCAPLTLI